MAKNYYLSGQWNVTCDVCSKKIKSSEAKNRWDGYITCPDCWEQRQPLDFIRARIDKISVPFQRPIPTLTFVPQNFEQPLTNKVDIDDRYSRIVQYIRSYSDTVLLSDNGITYQMDHGRSFTDSVSLSETFTSLVYTSLGLADTVGIADTTAKSVEVLKTDNTVTSDYQVKNTSSNYTDTVVLTETMDKVISVVTLDTASITDIVSITQEANDSINSSAINSQAIN